MATARKRPGWCSLARKVGLLAACLVLGASVTPAWAAPTVNQMLSYRPRQEGVDYTTPTGDAVNGCKVELVKGQRKGSGWLLRDDKGQPLRWFFDTNDDNKIDIWAYFKDGVEVYREIDTTFHGKPDQYRWLNSGGMKWGLDEKRDGKITTWKAISPEEVSQEVLQALVKKDYSRLQALMITDAEVKDLNLPAAMAARIRELQKGAPARFQDTVTKMTSVTPKAVWMHLETGVPRCLPADQIGTRYDLVKHPKGTILVDVSAEGQQAKNEWIQTGEMIQVGLAWRLLDAPTPGTGEEVVRGLGDPVSKDGDGKIKLDSSNANLMKLIEELTKLDQGAPPNNGTVDAAVVQHHLRRADLLEKIVAEVKDVEREPWIRQVADSLSTAAGASGKDNKTAMTRLVSLEGQLVSKMPGSNLAAYVTFREMQTDYSRKIATGESDFVKLQKEWVERLATFIQTYPRADDTPDVLLQAGMVSEFLDKDVEAKNWYAQLVKNFADSNQGKKASGAITRLDCEGKLFKLAGTLLSDTNVPFDIDSHRGKMVVVYYWAAWNSQSVGDFAKLKLLLDTYGKKGLELVCVNLDNKPEAGREFLARSPAPGTHLYQAGGLDGKLATDYGIMVLPNLFLVSKDGKVLNRKLQINNLEDEVKKQLK
jgi:hypothetical protein